MVKIQGQRPVTPSRLSSARQMGYIELLRPEEDLQNQVYWGVGPGPFLWCPGVSRELGARLCFWLCLHHQTLRLRREQKRDCRRNVLCSYLLWVKPAALLGEGIHRPFGGSRRRVGFRLPRPVAVEEL